VSSMPQGRLRQIPQLDSLRGLAAVAVVVAHFHPEGVLGVGSTPGAQENFFVEQVARYSLGNLAVVFFFTLSAFLLTYRARIEVIESGRFSPLRFLSRRCLRIWPLYFFIVICSFAVGEFSASPNLLNPFGITTDSWPWIHSHGWLFGAFVSNWSLAFNHIKGHVDSSGGALRLLWSIAVEEQFYLIYPLLVLAAFRFRMARWGLPVAIVGLSWAFRIWFSHLVPDSAPGSSGGLYYATLSYGESFLMGAIAGWICADFDWRKIRLLMKTWMAWPFLVVGLVLGRAWSNHIWYPYTGLSLWLFSAVAVYFAVFLTWIVASSEGAIGRLLASRRLTWLGALSYGIYLWHVPSNHFLSQVFRHLFPSSDRTGGYWVALALGLSLASAVVFAAATYHLIEKPFLRLKDRARPKVAPQYPELSPHPAVLRTRRFWACAVLAIGVFWLYGWAPASFPRAWTVEKPEGFYNEMADAFLSGQLHFKRAPDPRLAALANPYDPIENAAFRINDLSYFKGRYYMYMGAGPAIAVFAPFKVLTGRFITEPAAAWLLCSVGALAGCALIALICGRSEHGVSIPITAAGLLVLVTANGFSSVIAGATAQQLAIAAAFAFSMTSLLSLTAAQTFTGWYRPWLFLASCAYGLAVASRPNYLFGAIILLLPLRSSVARRGAQARILDFLAATVPYLAAVFLILLYNRARFAGVLEFGQRFQLGGWNQLNLAYSGSSHAAENVRYYLVGPGVFSPFFPFVSPTTWTAIGVLRIVPWLWLIPLGVWALTTAGTPALARFVSLAAFLLAACNFLTLAFLPSGNPEAVETSANSRYVLDFLPALIVMVSSSMAAMDWKTRRWPSVLRSIVIGLSLLLALASAVLGLSLDLGRFPTESLKAFAAVMNWPSYSYLTLKGTLYGPVRAELLFPKGRIGAIEPILSTGSTTAADVLFVRYEGADSIRFGFVSTGFIGPLSKVIQIDYGRPHVLTLSLGSLYPPVGSGALSSLDESQRAFLMRHLLVDVDGVRVFSASVLHHDALPWQIYLGRNDLLTGYSAPAFSGKVVATSRARIPSPSRAEIPVSAYGPITIDFKLPEILPPAGREPLLVTGVSQAGDLLTVEYAPGNRVRFALDHWGGKGASTDWIPCNFSIPHTLQISMGSLYPPLGTDSLDPIPAERSLRLKTMLRLELDGHEILDVPQETYDSSNYDVTVGVNAIGGSSCVYGFSGQILRVSRGPIK